MQALTDLNNELKRQNDLIIELKFNFDSSKVEKNEFKTKLIELEKNQTNN